MINPFEQETREEVEKEVAPIEVIKEETKEEEVVQKDIIIE